ncbi:MAG: hypothetical protein HYZ47_05615, partial [Simkania negevensis]|nr:hypothetical protein [Simkania negevensis]
GRAYGHYRERFSNGALRLEVVVIEGIGDVTEEAQKTYLFDGLSRAWDENGKLLAEINYEKGKLQGNAFYYYPSGVIQKLIPFEKHLIHGEMVSYSEQGIVNGKTSYKNGKKEGMAFFKGDASYPPYVEEYREDLLLRGSYHDREGNFISKVEEGEGKKAFFSGGRLYSLSEIQHGIEEGEILLFDENKAVINSFRLFRGLKHGEEKIYYPLRKGERDEKKPQVKCLIPWYEDMIQGIYRTWYEDGTLESEREMHQNEKQGLFCSWYKDNSLMFVEEYQHDVLFKGDYYKKGDPFPVSSVIKGEGKATLYDPEGILLKEISYYEGHPVSES